MPALTFPIGTKIGVIELDAAVSETHTLTANATTHKVERGAAITDHIRPVPVSLTIEGLITNTPIGRKQQTRAVQFAGSQFLTTADSVRPFGVPGYAEEAFAKLDDIRKRGELVTVVTSLRTYENMALIELQVPRDRTTGDAVRFTAKLVEIVIVENKVTKIQVQADPRANAKVKLGRQAKYTTKADKALRKIGLPLTGQTVGNFAPVERTLSSSFDRYKASVSRVFGGG
jgi:hypothetical protein